MNDRRKTVTAFAKAAMILFVIRLAGGLLIQLFPGAVLQLMGTGREYDAISGVSTVLRFLPLVRAGVLFFVCYALIMQSVKQNTKESARTALTVLLILLAVKPVAGTALSLLHNVLINRFYSAEALAMSSMLNTADGIASLIAGLSYPLLVAAAAVNRYRFED